MSLIQLEKIGVSTPFVCSILKSENIQNAFYSTINSPLYWSDNANLATGGLDLFSFVGSDATKGYHDNASDVFPYDTIGSGISRLLCYYSYMAKNDISAIEQNIFALDFQQYGNGLCDFRFCTLNKKSSNNPALINAIPTGRTRGFINYGSNDPIHISVIVDTDAKEMQIFALYCFGSKKKQGHGIINTSDERKNAYKALEDFLDFPSTDPWIDGGESTTGGGDGNLNITSDTIGTGALPISAVNTGFIQAFAPSISEVQELSSYMWSDGFLNLLSKFWNDPMSIIISLTQFPFFIPSTTSKIVQAGNVTTDVQMRVPDSQYVTLDCGKLNVDKFYDAYVDFEPYTQCEIFLPYIGTHKLSMDDISGKEVNPIYTFDILSGVCVCNIYVDGSIMYTFTGNCGISIPITSQSYSDTVKNTLSTGISAVLGAGFTSNVANVTGAVMTAKPHIERSGQIGGNGGLFSPQKPYLTFSIPRVCLPKNQNTFIGYPSFVEVKLSKLKGFTRVFDIRLKGMTCTETEYNQIVSLLKEGVIL